MKPHRRDLLDYGSREPRYRQSGRPGPPTECTEPFWNLSAAVGVQLLAAITARSVSCGGSQVVQPDGQTGYGEPGAGERRRAGYGQQSLMSRAGAVSLGLGGGQLMEVLVLACAVAADAAVLIPPAGAGGLL